MKNRVPRKKKKKAKRVKAVNDALTMTKAAIVTMQGVIQMAMIAF